MWAAEQHIEVSFYVQKIIVFVIFHTKMLCLMVIIRELLATTDINGVCLYVYNIVTSLFIH